MEEDVAIALGCREQVSNTRHDKGKEVLGWYSSEEVEVLSAQMFGEEKTVKLQAPRL